MSSATVSPSKQNDLADDSVELHEGWLLILGIVLIVLGILAIEVPLAAQLTVELFTGWLLVFSGVAHAVHTVRARRWPGFPFQMLLTLLNLGVGLLLLFNPQVVVEPTFLLSGFFLIEGVFKIAMGLQLRPMPRWGWLLLSGVLAMGLGILIGWQWWWEVPLWVMRLLLGVDLIFSGMGLIMIALAARRVQNMQSDSG